MITITRPVIKQCPYRDETDAGELEVTFPRNSPEMHELDRIVNKVSSRPATHEDFTREISALLPGEALVVTRWHTGAWTVVCREGGKPAA